MDFVDVSVPLFPGMVTYPGDPVVRLERVKSIAEGEPANVSRLDLGVHSGTHVDAPVHFFDGAPDSSSLDLAVLVGPAVVVAAAATGDVDEAAIEQVPAGTERVLFRTRNSALWERDEFAEDFAKLTEGAAQALVHRGVRLVGIDYLSVGGPDVHRVLLGARMVIVESLDLRRVEPGAYELVCLPVRLLGSDGVPARAILRRG
jgi:arylformamidase